MNLFGWFRRRRERKIAERRAERRQFEAEDQAWVSRHVASFESDDRHISVAVPYQIGANRVTAGTTVPAPAPDTSGLMTGILVGAALENAMRPTYEPPNKGDVYVPSFAPVDPVTAPDATGYSGDISLPSESPSTDVGSPASMDLSSPSYDTPSSDYSSPSYDAGPDLSSPSYDSGSSSYGSDFSAGGSDFGSGGGFDSGN